MSHLKTHTVGRRNCLSSVLLVFTFLLQPALSADYVCEATSDILCTWECGAWQCIGDTFTCNSDFGCELTCSGGDSCKNIEVIGNSSGTVKVECLANDACESADIHMEGDGYLYIDCADSGACDAVNVLCTGDAHCAMKCNSGCRSSTLVCETAFDKSCNIDCESNEANTCRDFVLQCDSGLCDMDCDTSSHASTCQNADYMCNQQSAQCTCIDTGDNTCANIMTFLPTTTRAVTSTWLNTASTSTSEKDDSNSGGSKGMGAGVLAAIIICSILGFCLLVAAVWYKPMQKYEDWRQKKTMRETAQWLREQNGTVVNPMQLPREPPPPPSRFSAYATTTNTTAGGSEYGADTRTQAQYGDYTNGEDERVLDDEPLSPPVPTQRPPQAAAATADGGYYDGGNGYGAEVEEERVVPPPSGGESVFVATQPPMHQRRSTMESVKDTMESVKDVFDIAKKKKAKEDEKAGMHAVYLDAMKTGASVSYSQSHSYPKPMEESEPVQDLDVESPLGVGFGATVGSSSASDSEHPLDSGVAAHGFAETVVIHPSGFAAEECSDEEKMQTAHTEGEGFEDEEQEYYGDAQAQAVDGEEEHGYADAHDGGYGDEERDYGDAHEYGDAHGVDAQEHGYGDAYDDGYGDRHGDEEHEYADAQAVGGDEQGDYYVEDASPPSEGPVPGRRAAPPAPPRR